MIDTFELESIPVLIGLIIFALYVIYVAADNIIWWKEGRKHNGSKE